jgi:ABC-2 type transport system ATP-binding protein
LLRVEGLVKRFSSKTAVHGLTFDLSGGQVVGFLGPNGAGKTTTLRMVTGLTAPTSGTVHIADVNVHAHQRAAADLYGYVPDSPFLFPKLTGPELIQFVTSVRGISSASAARFIDRWVERFELSEWRSTYLDECSLGTKRKWAILSALVHEPSVLILDEPLNGLDPKSVRAVKDLFQELRTKGHLVLMSTHLLDVVSAVCDSVMIINHGNLVLPCTPIRDVPSLEDTFLRMTDAAASLNTIAR